MARAITVLIGAVLLAACLVDVDYGQTRFRCASDGTCPDGQQCVGGFCSSGQIAGDAAPDSIAPDAAPDAPGGLVGRVLYWSFDEGSGVVAGDQSPTGADGTIEGAVFVASPHGTALSFDGALDSVSVAPAPAALSPAQVAVSAWVRPTEFPGEVASMGDSWGLRVTGTGVSFFVYEGVTWIAAESEAASLLDGEWHHVVGQYDGSVIEVYIDGQIAGSTAHDVPVSYTLGPNLVSGRHGNDGGDFDYAGEIDELEVFERPLELAEISERATR